MSGGLYVIVLRLARPASVGVGALGCAHLEAGTYLYVGSARVGLEARVRRHLAPDKKVRWHADYLTTHPGTERVGAVALEGEWSEASAECALNARIGELAPSTPVIRFGASDCRARCPAHLWYSRTNISIEEVGRWLAGWKGTRDRGVRPALWGPALRRG